MNTTTINNNLKFENRGNSSKSKKSMDSFISVLNKKINNSSIKNEESDTRVKDNYETKNSSQTPTKELKDLNSPNNKESNNLEKKAMNNNELDDAKIDNDTESDKINETVILENVLSGINIFDVREVINEVKEIIKNNEINGNIEDLVENIEALLDSQNLQKGDLVELNDLLQNLYNKLEIENSDKQFNGEFEKIATILQELQTDKLDESSKLEIDDNSKIEIDNYTKNKLDVVQNDNNEFSNEKNEDEQSDNNNGINSEFNLNKINSNTSAVNFDVSKEINSKDNLNFQNVNETTNSEIKKNIFEQVIENMKVNISKDKSEMKISLKPDFLGDMTLDIISKSGIVEAKALVKNNIVKEIIENNLVEFKENLKVNGINLEKFEVVVEQEMNFNQQNSSFLWSNNKNNKNRKNAYKEAEEIYFENIDTNNNEILIGTLDLKA